MKYFAFLASALRTRFAYRSQVWASMLGSLIEVLAAVAIWNAVYSGRASEAGVSLPDMVTYAVIAGMVTRSWTYETYLRKMGGQVKSGDVAVFLLKPISYPLMLMAGEVGELAFQFLVIQLPVAVVIALLYGVAPPPDLAHAMLFAAFFVLSFVIYFLMATLFGLAAFWLLTVHSMEWMLRALANILAGGLVPFWFFPAPFDTVLRFQPLAFVGFHPASVYLGKTGVPEGLALLGAGLGWVAVLSLCVGVVWTKTTTRLVVQGG